jgi:glutamate--cysteine ligase
MRGGGSRRVLAAQQAKVEDPELTPSAQVLAQMRVRGESFHNFARRHAEAHGRHVAGLALAAERGAQLEGEAVASLARQAALEAADDGDFPIFLDRYFKQS